ncbi:hypothetical protein ABBQ32_14140 [Trebouxia sp. C0010 RCD-2024]
MRWETANADGKNAGFDPAVPLAKFKALDRAAAVTRALPLVTAAHRSLQEGASSSSSVQQAASFLTFTAADLAPAVAAACQHAEHAVEDDQDEPDAANKLQFSGDRMIPLASWTGTGLGLMPRAAAHGGNRASDVLAPMIHSQASVHQASQDSLSAEETVRIPLVPADRAVGAGQLACPVMPAQAWCGAPVLPPTRAPVLSLNSYCSAVGLGQERDDIQELEKLWLSAHGRRRGSGPPHSQTAGANQPAAAHAQRSLPASRQNTHAL